LNPSDLAKKFPEMGKMRLKLKVLTKEHRSQQHAIAEYYQRI